MLNHLPLLLESDAELGGVPLHPLAAHLPVVMLPFAALLLIAAAAVPAVRRRFLGLAVLAAAVGAVGAFIARETGEGLAEMVGEPLDHSAAADRAFVSSLLMLGLSAVWWWLSRRDRPRADTERAAAGSAAAGTSDPGHAGSAQGTHGAHAAASAGAGSGSTLRTVLGALTALTAVATLIFTIQTGHSGAQAVWGPGEQGRVAASTETTPTDAPSTGGAITAEEVSAHDTLDSCWSIIDGSVYDLTDWAGRHPGGERAIESLCGIDGTERFQEQHGGDGEVADRLAEFRIGTLAA